MNQKIVHANPKVRLATTAILAVAALLLLGVLFLLRSYLASQLTLMETDFATAMNNVLTLVTMLAVMMGAALLVLSMYFAYLAFRIRATGQFPPPGSLVVKDTPLLTGAAAARRVWIAGAMSLVLAFAATVGMYTFQNTVHRVMKSGTNKKPAGERLVAPRIKPNELKS